MAKVTVVERTTVKVIFTKKSYLSYQISQTNTYCWVQNSLCSAMKNFFNQKNRLKYTYHCCCNYVDYNMYTTFKYNSVVLISRSSTYVLKVSQICNVFFLIQNFFLADNKALSHNTRLYYPNSCTTRLSSIVEIPININLSCQLFVDNIQLSHQIFQSRMRKLRGLFMSLHLYLQFQVYLYTKIETQDCKKKINLKSSEYIFEILIYNLQIILLYPLAGFFKFLFMFGLHRHLRGQAGSKFKTVRQGYERII